MAPTVIKQFTLNELRGVLSDEIEKLRNGSSTPAGVNAISNASGKILSTFKLELEVAKMLGRKPSGSIAGLLGEESNGTEGA